MSGVHALRSYLKLICGYELHSLPNKEVRGAKDEGKNYIKVRPLLVRHLLRNRLLMFQSLKGGRKTKLRMHNPYFAYFNVLFLLTDVS